MPETVKRSSIEQLLSEHHRIALDSNVLIYLLDADGPRSDLVALIVDGIEEGRVEAVLSTIGLVEVLTGPARSGQVAAFEEMAAELRELGLDVVALGAGIAEDAAWIRGRDGFDLGDAVHLASARASGATLFITNDRRIKAITRLEVVYLDELTA
jgi:predicted nucleic acid-binding protein